MSNPFAKPETPGQWLASSVCWTVSCVGAWLLMSCLLAAAWQKQATLAEWLGFGSFWMAHFLIWRRALAGGQAFLQAPETATSALGAVGCLWLAFLFVFQMIVLVTGLATTGLFVLFSS